MSKRTGWVASLSLCVAVVACGEGQAEDAPTVQAAEVVRQDLRITAEATGLIEPIKTVEVKSKASGEVLKTHVEIGDEVAPGTLLAEVDPRDVRNGFNQAQADLEVAQARVEIADAQRKRSQELLEAGVITTQENEGADLEYANARAALVRGQTNLELARLRLGDVTIRAPFAGTILARTVEEGQVIQSASGNVSGGTTLMIMANLDEMRVRTLVDETDVGQIHQGLTASVVVEAFPNRTFMGEVEKVEPQAVVQQNVTMFPVIVNLDNRNGLLKPGMNAEVEMLIDERRDILTLPNNAIVTPREMAPAAMVLGLDPDAMNLGPGGDFARRGGGPPGGRSASGGDGGTPQGRAGGERAGALTTDEGMRARFDSLRAKVQSGEISQDSMRAVMASLRGGAGSSARPRGERGDRQPAGDQAEGAMPSPGGAPEAEPRRAVAFVMKGDGTIEPRFIMIGINDWDNTEVVSGLDEGEQVALIGAAQLQAQQQEWINRIRERTGGPFPGAGGRR